MKYRILSNLALVALSAVMLGATREPVSIAWHPKQGNELHYHYKSTVNLSGMGELVISANILHTNKEVPTDGNVTIVEEQSGFSATMNGNDMSSMAGLPSKITETTVMKLNGEQVSKKSDAPENMQNPRLDAISEFVFPDHAVNVGDTWTRTGKGDGKTRYDYTATYTYQGTETVGGVESYKIGMEFNETNATTNMHAKGTIWVAIADGELVKVSDHIEKAEFGPQLPPSDADVEIVRA